MIRSLPPYWFDKTGKTQRVAKSQDSGGGSIETYNDYLTGVKFRFNLTTGVEQSSRERINTVNPSKIYVNGNPALDIIATDRLIYNNRIFDIKSVNNFDEADVYQTLNVVEVKPSDLPITFTVSDANDGGVLVTFSYAVNLATIDPTAFSISSVPGTASSATGEGTNTEIGGVLPPWAAGSLVGLTWASTSAFCPGVAAASGVVS